jgi:hypothetical protein
MLEDIGWRGVCIEGHPLLYKYVQRNRPLCLNVNAVVTAQAGEVEYVYTNELSGPMAGSRIVEFMSPQKLKDFELHAANGGATVLREKIEARTLDDIVGTFGMQVSVSSSLLPLCLPSTKPSCGDLCHAARRPFLAGH